MQVDITIANEDAAGRNYLTWAPVQDAVRLLDVDGEDGADPVNVTLSNDDTQVGGQLEFAATRDQARAPSLDLMLPTDGTPMEFWVAGVVGKPSSADGDAAIRVARTGEAEALTSKAVMVRIRKNANQLGPAEEDRFTTTVAKLNDQGAGLFKDFREMHKERLAAETGARPARVPVLAPGLPAGPGASAAADRPERDAALLALPRSGTECVLPRVHGANRCARQRGLERDQPAASVADGGGPGYYSAAPFSTRRPPVPS
jgi:hypothetical protein